MKGIAAKAVIIAAISALAIASLASAGEGFRGAIHGKYAFTGTGTCLFSPSGFTESQGAFIPNGPFFSMSTSAWEGVYEFAKDGTGTVTATLHTVASGNNSVAFPGGFPKASKSDLTFDFDYDVIAGARIHFTTTPQGVRTLPSGAKILDSGPQSGVITDNGKTILVTCGVPVPPSPTMFCNTSLILSWIGD